VSSEGCERGEEGGGKLHECPRHNISSARKKKKRKKRDLSPIMEEEEPHLCRNRRKKRGGGGRGSHSTEGVWHSPDSIKRRGGEERLDGGGKKRKERWLTFSSLTRGKERKERGKGGKMSLYGVQGGVNNSTSLFLLGRRGEKLVRHGKGGRGGETTTFISI